MFFVMVKFFVSGEFINNLICRNKYINDFKVNFKTIRQNNLNKDHILKNK